MHKKNIQKIGIVLFILAAIGIFQYFNLGQYLTLSYLKNSQEKFTALYSEHSITVISVYMFIYIVVTALSLPGAAVLTLTGGALFGFWVTLVAVSFASSIGATLAFLVSRFLLRDWVQNKFGKRLQSINKGIEKEGGFYLFSLRLVPIFPFFVINLAMGLTGIRVFTFYWVSQIGMLPGTAVYVNAGKELGQIKSVSDVLSPELIVSFVLLGLFPITAKKLLKWYTSRKNISIPTD